MDIWVLRCRRDSLAAMQAMPRLGGTETRSRCQRVAKTWSGCLR